MAGAGAVAQGQDRADRKRRESDPLQEAQRTGQLAQFKLEIKCDKQHRGDRIECDRVELHGIGGGHWQALRGLSDRLE